METMEEKLAALNAKRGSNLKVWWNGLKWILMAAFGILASAGSFNWAHGDGGAEFWAFGIINIGIVLYFCIKGFRAYKKELDEINAEIAKVIKQGNNKKKQ